MYDGGMPAKNDRTGEDGRETAFRINRYAVRSLSPTYADAFLGLVRAGEHLERTLDSELRRAHGIGLRGFEVLLHLGAFSPDGRLPLTQLTVQAPLSQSRMSRLVAELERDGLVSRETDERDTRAVIVAITEKGLGLLREAQDTHYDGLERHLFSRLTRDDIAQLAKVTRKLLGRVDDEGAGSRNA
jgi:DNA-binding MarR family transcriptional regulator